MEPLTTLQSLCTCSAFNAYYKDSRTKASTSRIIVHPRPSSPNAAEITRNLSTSIAVPQGPFRSSTPFESRCGNIRYIWSGPLATSPLNQTFRWIASSHNNTITVPLLSCSEIQTKRASRRGAGVSWSIYNRPASQRTWQYEC